MASEEIVSSTPPTPPRIAGRTATIRQITASQARAHFVLRSPRVGSPKTSS